MKKLMKKRTGFTLVELLIVIIIIGILAGAMLLVAGSGTDKANATKIVSEMRSLKAAALMKWADDGNWNFVETSGVKAQGKVGKYMDRDVDKATVASYDIISEDGIFVEASNIIAGAGPKLKIMANDSGISEDADGNWLMKIK